MMLRKIFFYFAFSSVFCLGVYYNISSKETYNKQLLFSLSLFSCLFLFTFVVFPAWKKIQKVELNLSELSKKLNLDDGEPLKGAASLTQKISKLSQIAEQSEQFVLSLKNGDSKSDISNHFKENNLVKALYQLKTHMDSLSKREAERQWFSESMSRLIDLLKSNQQNENDFYDAILSALVRFVGANQGGLFIVNEKSDQEKSLELASCYASDKKQMNERKIEIGQGLVGQVYVDGNTLVLKHVPDDYVKIVSGLGESRPDFVVIVPLKLNDQIECIVELASFEELPPYKIQFVEKVGESIASYIMSSKTNLRVSKLLAESLSNAEEMRSQEEEMRQNMEELEATQEEMARKEKELINMLEQSTQQQRNLNQKIAEVEKLKLGNENHKKDVIEILNAIPAKIFLKDKDGNMVICNEAVAKAYNLTVDKLIGTHDSDHFDSEQAKEFRKQELDVMYGGMKSYIQEERLNGQLRVFKTTKMPFFIHHLNQTGLLGYQFDITDSYKSPVASQVIL